jgi:tetratricopeptide (TPR) repeat protein
LGGNGPALWLALTILYGLVSSEGHSSTSPPLDAPELVSRPSEGVPSTLAALVFGGRDGGNLPAFAAALPLPADRDRSPVPFVVEVDGSSLLISESESLTLEFFVYALDADRRVRAHFSQRLRLDPEALETAPIAGGLRYEGHLELPVGNFLLRFLVREPESRRYALRTVQVEIPASSARVSVPVALRFAGDESLWLEAREARAPAAGVDLLDDLPVALPSALPVLAPGREQALDLVFYGALPRDQLLNLAILDATGKRVGKAELRTSEEPSTIGGRLYRLPVSFKLPALEEGSYGLELDAASARSLANPLQVAVFVVEAPSARASVWTELWGTVSRRRPADSTRSARKKGRRGKAVRAVASAYREALSRFALGSESEAVEELVGFESKTFELEGDESLRDLERGEWGVAAGLADNDPEALLPLVSLHLRLDDLYRSERNYLLASHAQRMAVSLATEYAERVPAPEAQAIASLALTVLGTDLQELQLWSSAQRLLEQAIAIDSGNTLAILSLAVGSEKRGLYREAVRYLERLVDLDPKSAEGRLRLAINLRRVGQPDRAVKVLLSVIGEANPSWALALAYQELGRMMLTSGRWSDAVRLLEDGVARLPRQRRLYLLRAYALDRTGEGRAASDVIDETARIPVGEEPSPRYLYNRRTQGDREEIRRLLARNSTLRLAALADSLAEAAGNGRS